MDQHKKMHREMKSQNRAASNGSDDGEVKSKEPQIFYKERPAKTVR